MHVPTGHSFPDATRVAFALGLGPPSLLAAILLLLYCYSIYKYFDLAFIFSCHFHLRF